MTTNTLAAIRERANKRTRGAWFAHEPHDSRDIEIICDTSPMGSDMEAEFESIGFVYEAEDGEFIAHAPTDIAALLAHVAALTARAEAAEADYRTLAAQVARIDSAGDVQIDDLEVSYGEMCDDAQVRLTALMAVATMAGIHDRRVREAADALAAHAANGESAGNGGA